MIGYRRKPLRGYVPLLKGAGPPAEEENAAALVPQLRPAAAVVAAAGEAPSAAELRSALQTVEKHLAVQVGDVVGAGAVIVRNDTVLLPGHEVGTEGI